MHTQNLDTISTFNLKSVYIYKLVSAHKSIHCDIA